MINDMLASLEVQMRHAVDLQKSGNFQEALGIYELIFEALRFYEELGYKKHTSHIHSLALAIQPTPALVLYCHALILFYRRCHTSAMEAINVAIALAPDISVLYVLKGKIQTALGYLSDACETYRMIQEIDPSYGEVSDTLFMLAAEKEMPGPDYYGWLQRFHQWMQPASYVEIGLGHGRSLALAGDGTRAVGIDPYQGFWDKLHYVSSYGPAALFPMTSDDFFVRHNLSEVLGQETFDLAFIDGLHLFEQVLKDFINLERYARPDSIVLIHDCLPITPIVAERERCTGFWTGDVWRIIPCLKTFRPDLKIMTIPTKPSGLGVVTNLTPSSTILAENYNDIVSYYLSLKCPESFNQLRMLCSVGPADEEHVKQQFCRV
jgi:tetratricopeptide (TPR) repeat protein